MSQARAIFISGWGTRNDVWTPLVECFTRRPTERRIPWWDCLGEGEDDNALLKALRGSDEAVVLVGWSLGGIMALAAATRRRDRVAGLVLISSAARMTATEDCPGVDPHALRAVRMELALRSSEALRSFAELCVAPSGDDAFRDTFLAQASRIEAGLLEAGVQYLERTDLRRELASLDVPALVIHGADDRVIPPASARYLADALPRARLFLVPDGSHALVSGAALLHVAREIESFLDEHFGP